MKVKITRVFEMDDEEVDTFMFFSGYTKYTREDLKREMKEQHYTEDATYTDDWEITGEDKV